MVLAIDAKFTVTVSFVEHNCWLPVKLFTMTGGHLGKGNIGDCIGRSNREKILNPVPKVLSLPCRTRNNVTGTSLSCTNK